MKIDIEAHGFELDSDLDRFVKCCAAFELGPRRSQVESVRIQLAHVQEPRHRKDRYCLVKVSLSDGKDVLARESDADLHIAIHRALERAGSLSVQAQSREHRYTGRPPATRQHAQTAGEPNWAA